VASVQGRLVHIVAREYWNGWLYAIEPSMVSAHLAAGVDCRRIEDVDEIAKSRFAEIREQAWDREPDRAAFGAWVEGELAAVCWFQARESYRRHGGLFRLRDDEAELAQVTTASAFRTRGIGRQLIQHGVVEMGRSGFMRLYAKIWRDNAASIRAFESAGWRLEYRFVSIHWRVLNRPSIYKWVPRRRQAPTQSSGA
jgi:GNAT superfamily N-acetyltransferase